MRIISFIEDAQVSSDILTHLGLWLVRSRPLPKIHASMTLSKYKASASCRIINIHKLTPMSILNTLEKNTFSHNAL